jgi:hypothetical protein
MNRLRELPARAVADNERAGNMAFCGPCQADFENAEDVFGLAASTDPVLPADFEALGALIAARLKIYEGSAHYVALIKVLLKESCSELKVRCSHRPQSIAFERL